MNWLRIALLSVLVVATDTVPAYAQDLAASALRVGIPVADSFSYSIRQPGFMARIPLLANEAGTFRFTVTPLLGADGAVVPVALQLDPTPTADSGRTLQLSKYAQATLVLRAELPRIGSYRGSFTVLTAGSYVTRAYTVAWARRTSPVTVTGAGSGAVTLGANEVTIPFAVHDTSGAAITLYPIRLDELRWVRTGDTTFSVPIGKMSVRRAGASEVLDTVRLAPNASESLELVVENALTYGAGAYVGSLRIAGPDFAAQGVTVKLFARRDWWFAAGIIVLGILIAEVFRRIQDDVRPRLLLQRRCAALLESLAEVDARVCAGGLADAVEAALIATLAHRLKGMFDDPKLGARATADGELADLARRIDRVADWVNVHRAIESLQPASLRGPLRLKLETVTVFLKDGALADEAADKAAGATLRALPAAIREASRKHLTDRIADFKQEIEAARAQHGSSEALLTRLRDDVESLLDAATSAVNEERLEDGRTKFDQARSRYAAFLTTSLQIRLAGARPGWMDEATWNTAKASVETEVKAIASATTPEGKLDAYARAHGLYLRELARTLERAATSLLAAGPTAEEKDRLDAVVTAAVSARSIASIPDLKDAAQAMKSAEEAWNAYKEAQKMGGVPQGTTTSTAPADVPGHVPEGIPSMARVSPIAGALVPRQSANISQRIAWLDWGISLLAGVLAVVLGINLLWAPDLTWGTSGDVFAALFWGLGVQQTGNTTFRGVANLLSQIGGRQAGAP